MKDLIENPESFTIKISENEIKESSGRNGQSLKLQSMLSNDSNSFVDALNQNCDDLHQKIAGNISHLKLMIVEQHPLPAYENVMSEAENNLSSDFDRFFGIITMYRSGVFSYNVRETIEKLGLGRKLDSLENTDFSDIEKEVIKQEARETIFTERAKVFNQFKRENISLEAEAAKLLKDFNNLPDWKKLPKYSSHRNDSDLEGVKDDLENYVLLEANELIQQINTKLTSSLNAVVERWEKEIIDNRKAQEKYFLSVILASIIIWLISCFLYINLRSINVSSDIFTNILLALLSNAIFSGIGFLIAKAFDRFPKKIQITKSRLLEDFRRDTFEFLDSDISDILPKENSKISYYLPAKIDEEVNRVISFLSSYWTNELVDKPISNWLNSSKLSFQGLKEINARHQLICNDFVEFSGSFSERVSSYFSDVSANLEKLRDYSNTLKQKSVDPSFELLASTRDILQNLKERIDDVDFE